MTGWWKSLNAARSWWDHLRGRPALVAWPKRIHLEVNDFCNLACPVCPRHNPAIPRDTGSMDLAVVEALRPAFRRATHVGLAGNGEPFLHPRLFDILDIIVSEKAVPSVITNATLLDAERARRLIAYGPLILMASIDGGTEAVYEEMRHPAIFEETRARLLRLREEKEIAGSPYPVVNFLVTLCRTNAGDLDNIMRLAGQVGAQRVTIQNCFPYSDEARARMGPDGEEREAILASARRVGEEYGVWLDYLPMAMGMDQRRDPAASGAAHTGARYCPNLWSQLHVEMDGQVRVCCFSDPIKIGNVLTMPVPDIWNHPVMVATRRSMLQGGAPGHCADCYLLDSWSEADATAQARREWTRSIKGES